MEFLNKLKQKLHYCQQPHDGIKGQVWTCPKCRKKWIAIVAFDPFESAMLWMEVYGIMWVEYNDNRKKDN